MNDELAGLEQILTISHKMLEEAQATCWEEVSRLEASRRELLETFFSMPVKIDFKLRVADGVKSILAIDQTIMELGLTEKLELEQVLLQIEHGKKAVKAYNS